MPTATKRVCAEPGCPNLVTRGRCPEHTRQQRQQHRRHYAGGQGTSYGSRWRRVRQSFLEQHPLCVDCEAEGRLEPATDVDHVVPHQGRAELFWDPANWAPRCKSHHSAKTAREVGFAQREPAPSMPQPRDSRPQERRSRRVVRWRQP